MAEAEFDTLIGNINTEIEASRIEFEGRRAALEGRQAQRSAFLRAGTTLLTSAAIFGSQFGSKNLLSTTGGQGGTVGQGASGQSRFQR